MAELIPAEQLHRAASAELYPTKTRLALLRAAADGHLSIDENDETVWLDLDWRHPKRANARYEEARDAGWLERGEEIATGSRIYWIRPTDAGRALLDAREVAPGPGGQP